MTSRSAGDHTFSELEQTTPGHSLPSTLPRVTPSPPHCPGSLPPLHTVPGHSFPSTLSQVTPSTLSHVTPSPPHCPGSLLPLHTAPGHSFPSTLPRVTPSPPHCPGSLLPLHTAPGHSLHTAPITPVMLLNYTPRVCELSPLPHCLHPTTPPSLPCAKYIP